ncbi:alpha-2C adrenergic receptor-like [Engraulis encrasicolus]|uniref:alpha-2C adrenergic receptor-like n=1 Tax=Engraulis encrasicolus TaxID=184585 RepID=UPI002FD5F771
MAQKRCPAGSKWDSLTLNCVHPRKLLPPKPFSGIPPVLQPATVAPTEAIPAAITVSVWVCVAVAMSGFILVILLLFVWRRLPSHSPKTDDKEAQGTDASHPAALAATPPVPEGLPSPAGLPANGHHHPHHLYHHHYHRPSPTHSSSSYQHRATEVGRSSREEDTCNVGLSGYCSNTTSSPSSSSTSSSSHHVCNGNSRIEGGIPLPATELGGAALVTTKTVQYAAY